MVIMVHKNELWELEKVIGDRRGERRYLHQVRYNVGAVRPGGHMQTLRAQLCLPVPKYDWSAVLGRRERPCFHPHQHLCPCLTHILSPHLNLATLTFVHEKAFLEETIFEGWPGFRSSCRPPKFQEWACVVLKPLDVAFPCSDDCI